jgi:hypothetical protein
VIAVTAGLPRQERPHWQNSQRNLDKDAAKYRSHADQFSTQARHAFFTDGPHHSRMGQRSVLFGLLLMVFIADMVGNQAIVTRHLVGYSFGFGRYVQDIAGEVTDMITTGR